MPVVERQDLDQLNAILSVKIERADYAKDVKAQMKEAQKKANMKGFRAGKAPLSIVEKMYGKSIVFDAVNKVVNQELNDYLDAISETKNILGQPLPIADDEANFDFRPKKANDYTFRFKLGFAPEFELKGYDKEAKFTSYNIDVTEEALDKEVENLKNQFGERTNPTEDIQAKDVLKLNLKELDGEAIKEGGIENTTSVAVDLLAEELQANVLTMKAGASFNVNIKDLDSKMDQAKAGTLLLGLEDNSAPYGENYVATIEEVTRQETSEINDEFIAKAFPGNEDIKTVEDIRAYMKGDIVKYYTDQADKLLFAQMQRELLEKNEFDLPDAFLKEWIVASDENATVESTEAQYPSFKQGLKWSHIQSKIADKSGVKVEENEVENAIREEISNYFASSGLGAFGDNSMMDGMVEKFMKDREHVNRTAERIINDKILVAAKEEVTLEMVDVNQEEFNDIIKKYNEEFAQSNKSADEELTETVEELVEDAVVEEATEE
ncbi:MAG: trigger factor [Saprospiraceae bacterium]